MELHSFLISLRRKCKAPSFMKLSDLKTGETAVVVKISGHGSFRKRITEMGFVKGSRVKVILNAPLRDPIEYEIIGYKISLRREEAEKIEVLTREEAREMLKKNPEAFGPSQPRRAIEADECEDTKKYNPQCSNSTGEDISGQDNDPEFSDDEIKALVDKKRKSIRVALVGNPNCGKTSLFNIAANAHEHVGNYSGVTVDAKEGVFEHGGYSFTLVDLPGTYSLSAYSPEELYVRKNLIDETPDVVINVIDASNLQRNLYLTTQVIDMNLRMVVALNMYDELKASGDQLDIKQLGYLLGLPIVPTISRTGEGIEKLFDTVIAVYEHNTPELSRHIHINHGPELEQSIDRIKLILQKNDKIRQKYSTRYLAIKYLENDSDIAKVVEALPERDEIIAARFEEQKRLKDMLGVSAETAIVEAKYAFIQGALAETWKRNDKGHEQKTFSEKIDAVVTNKWLAFPIFLVLLFIVFQGTFTLGAYPVDWIQWCVDKFGEMVRGFMGEWWLRDLIVDGIIGGVGSVLVFLPNILLLYLFISLLEDSGYMARAAFIMDRMMHKMGLHGKSFIPMIMGFGCNVPAIMATRTIESRKSRLLTILVIPFMSCSGRLPVYILLTAAFFPHHAGLVLLGLYVLGIALAVISARGLSHFIKDDDLPFVMELPPYRIPTAKAVFRHTWEKCKEYLSKIGGVILVCSIAIWFLSYFPNHDKYSTAEEQQENSFLGYLGKAVEPALAPLGFDWKMDIGILSGIGAKELIVSTLGIMYSEDDAAGSATVQANIQEAESEGTQEAVSADAPENTSHLQKALQKHTTPAGALAYLVFILLYLPCIATFFAIRHEAGSWKWAFLSAAMTLALAWIFSFAIFRLFSLIL